MFALVIALLAPAVDQSGHWYHRLACEAVGGPCGEWRTIEARRCDAETPDETCVTLVHPTAAGGGTFLGVYDGEGLAKMSIDRGKGRWAELYSR